MHRVLDAVRSKAERFGFLEPNLELAFVGTYDTDICDGIPEGHFASGNEEDFEEDHHGRIWFKFLYDETNEKLILCLYKGRNFKKSTDESSPSLPKEAVDSPKSCGGHKLSQKSKRRRTNSSPGSATYSLGVPMEASSETTTTSRPKSPKKKFLIHRDKKNRDISISIYLYPDPRVHKQVESDFRGLPDPVFADRVVFQVPEEFIESATLLMAFFLHSGDSAPVEIGEIAYPLKGMVLNTVVYQDMQKYSPEIPMFLVPRSAIHCAVLLSLGYSNKLIHCITIDDLRVCVKLYKFIPDLESQIKVELYNDEESTGVSTGQWKPQKTKPSTAASSKSKTCDTHVNQFFHDVYKFPVRKDRINTTWMTITLRLKGHNIGEDMQGILVLGPPMLSMHGTGIYHWKDMLDNPNTVRTQIHYMILTTDPKFILLPKNVKTQ